MQCYCGAGEDHLPFCIGSFRIKEKSDYSSSGRVLCRLRKCYGKDQSIKVENEYYIVKYANWRGLVYNVIILLMKDNWLLAISYKIFL